MHWRTLQQGKYAKRPHWESWVYSDGWHWYYVMPVDLLDRKGAPQRHKMSKEDKAAKDWIIKDPNEHAGDGKRIG